MDHPTKTAMLVFAAALTVLALFAWDRVYQPSPHFHFVDLAHSFLDGRLDTDTPRVRRNAAPVDDAPVGFYEAVKRQTTNPDGSARGWNDWSSYRVLTLKSGEVLKGVFPWRNQPKNSRKNEFHTLDGNTYIIDCRRSVESGCYGNKPEHLKIHVSFPPAPALLMMPMAWVQGYNVNDVWFTLLFGALNAALLFLLLSYLSRTRHSDRSLSDNLWLTALFVFGTVHFFSAVRGEVWFTALIVGVTFNLLALHCMVDLKRPLLAGIFVALGMATRVPLAFSCTLVALLAFFPDGRFRQTDWKGTFKSLVLFAVPVAFVLAALIAYNYARFDNGFEFGHTYLQEGQRPAIRSHGLMSSVFLKQNLSAAFTNSPEFLSGAESWIRISKHGLGLLWTTPILFCLAFARKRTWLFKSLLLTAAVVAVPGLFYQNTGWEQFGYRFGLDWLPYLVVAFAIGGVPLNRWTKALIIAGIVVNTFGAATFGRFSEIYY